MEKRELKTAAKVMADYLAEQGVTVPHTRVLEALSRGIGERNWSTLSARLDKTAASGDSSAAIWAAGVPMSDAQFVARKGLACPHCGSRELNAGNLQADGPVVTDETHCESCDKWFRTHYTVSGWEAMDPEDATTPRRMPGVYPSRGAMLDAAREGSLFFESPFPRTPVLIAERPSPFAMVPDMSGSMRGLEPSREMLERVYDAGSVQRIFQLRMRDWKLPEPKLGWKDTVHGHRLIPVQEPKKVPVPSLVKGLMARVDINTAPAKPAWDPKDLAAMNAFKDTLSRKDVLVFSGQVFNATNWHATAYPAKEAVFYLWPMLEGRVPTSANDMVAMLADQVHEAMHKLYRAEVSQVTKAVRYTLAEALSVVRKTLAEYSFATPEGTGTYELHEGVRPDVVSDVEDHVRHMAKRHGFSLTGAQVADAVQDSADQLNYDISPIEVLAVCDKLSS